MLVGSRLAMKRGDSRKMRNYEIINRSHYEKKKQGEIERPWLVLSPVDSEVELLNLITP